jgi:hypothetical protein
VRLRAVVRLQNQNVDALFFQPKSTVVFRAAQLKLFLQINDGPLRSNGLKSRDSSRRDGRTLPERSVAHLQRHRSERVRTYPVFTRLQPEVMRCDERRTRTHQDP